MSGPVVLLTDFGLADPYVGQMKGALAAHSPGAAVIDLTHQVEPFGILQGAFFLAASRQHFPAASIFVCVVDPGVGGERRIVLLEKHGQFFLAPDNGLLSLVAGQPGPARARDVTPPWRRDTSATFHGRDLLVPLAARLAHGESPASLGDEVKPQSLVRLPLADPLVDSDEISASILHVDRFGNAITNLDIERFGQSVFKARGAYLSSPGETPLYAVVTYENLGQGQLGVLKGSQGYLELAMNKASAASALALSPGMAVTLALVRR
jgi:hypothetical protein